MKSLSFAVECRTLLRKTDPFLANAANFTGWLNQKFEGLNWVGFYLARGSGLWLGPFQGKPACTWIPFGRGACGKTAAALTPLIIADVDQFEDHIVCDPCSRSEAVFPLVKEEILWGGLDLDSPHYDYFAAHSSILQELVRIFVDNVTMDLPYGVPVDYLRQFNR